MPGEGDRPTEGLAVYCAQGTRVFFFRAMILGLLVYQASAFMRGAGGITVFQPAHTAHSRSAHTTTEATIFSSILLEVLRIPFLLLKTSGRDLPSSKLSALRLP